MSNNQRTPEDFQKEINYYKAQLDEISGQNLKLDYAVSGIRHELNQKKAGFNLLARLPQEIVGTTKLPEILRITAVSINSNLGMDKTIVLLPDSKPNLFRPLISLGAKLDEAILSQSVVDFPEAIVKGQEIPIINKSTPSNSFYEQLRELFGLPYFLIYAIVSENQTIAILISGRTLEARPLYPPLDKGDVDTFVAIGNLIAASVEALKVTTMREMDRLKGEFFANISHEFRTPITLTIGPLEALIAGRYGEINELIKKEGELILRNQKRLLDLINQILDLAKLESGQMKLAYARISKVNDFLAIRIEQFANMAESRGIELKKKFSLEVDQVPLFADPEKIDKVFFNLMSNAIKFTPKGSITVETRLEKSQLLVSVSDSGIGIRADQIEHIFDRFKQADGSQSREFAGTGIGLSLVKEVVQIHGGEMTVASEYGNGSTFTFSLPLGVSHLPEGIKAENLPDEKDVFSKVINEVIDIREGKANPAELALVEQMNAEMMAKKERLPKILYVDDNADLRNFVHGILKSDFKVFLAVNGLDGFEKAKQFDVDLVLSDLMMPVMTGTEFLKQLRSESQTSSLPFVMLTAMSGSTTKIEELQNGVDDFLTKPFSEAELRARISNLLKIREQQRIMKRDLRAARDIQFSLLPSFDNTFSNIRAEFFYHPCDDLSGDFFEIVQIGRRIYFYVADVTSHGTTSAQVTYLLKGLFKNATSSMAANCDVVQLAQKMAADFWDYKLEYLVSLTLGVVDMDQLSLEFVSSGAPGIISVKSGVTFELGQAANPLFGYLGEDKVNLNFEKNHERLEPGQKLYIFTDGWVEFDVPDSGRPLGTRKFKNLLGKLQGGDWRKELFDQVVKINGSRMFPDDLTILCLSVEKSN